MATPVTADQEDEAETRPDWKRGLVMGRFMPPHRGHEFLIGFAQAQVDQLSIGSRASQQDPISPTLRAGWLKALFPDCKVIADDHFFKVDVFFSSDARHKEFAEKLGAQLVLCDPERCRFRPPRFVPTPFDIGTLWRPYLKVVRVVGAEGSGKTTLCQRLANHFRTCFVAEFAAALAARNGGKLPKSELANWARQHLAARQALASVAMLEGTHVWDQSNLDWQEGGRLSSPLDSGPGDRGLVGRTGGGSDGASQTLERCAG